MPRKNSLDLVRALGVEDGFYFIQTILGYDEVIEKIHGDILNLLNSRIGKESLLLIPRKHFKTSVVTIGWVVWQIIRNPNIRILITNKILGIAFYLRAFVAIKKRI